jgi:hypothetical protein
LVLKKNYTPAWNWEQINRMIVTEVISEYYVNWYYDYCKPCLETVKPVPGHFFSVTEMLLDYIHDLVDDMYYALYTSYELDQTSNTTYEFITEVLSKYRSMELNVRMAQRFKNIQQVSNNYRNNSV